MRYLLCTNASSGFVQTTIGLAQTLQARRHQVAIVTDQSQAPIIAAAGVERIPRGDQDGPSFQIAMWGKPLAVAIQVKHLEYAVRRFAPDVLVGQPLTLGAFLVRERCQLPLAVVGLSAYLLPRSNAIFATNDPDPEATSTRVAWRYRDLMELYAAARQAFTLPPADDDPADSLMLGDRFLLQSVPELYASGPPLPSRVRFIGACQWEPALNDSELAACLSAAHAERRPVLYVQPGRTFDQPCFWAGLVAAVAGSDVQVVAAVERLDGDLGELPPNFYVRPHLDQGSVLPYAQAVICGGNSTAALGALSHGLPQLIIPAGGEQHDVAELCAAAGVARVCPATASAQTITQSIQAVLYDPAIRSRARQFKRAFERIPPFQRAADELEQMDTAPSVVSNDTAIATFG